VTGELAAVNLDEVVAVVKADLAELIRTKGAEVEALGPLPEVWGDRDRIGQLVANLVGNGLKYNRDPRPRVEIGALPDYDGPHVTFFVRDNGIGIEPQFHAKIFQLFRRLHTREEYEGTGAGLAICTKIVQAHGGRIWVESEPNHGATFFVSLPKPSSGRPPSPDRPDACNLISTSCWSRTARPTPRSSSAPCARPTWTIA
jgi:light-regulated signal transduction histidine kinase (bacteriophytochrome)